MIRVRHKPTGWTGTLLRYERYPHVGRQATVKWDWAFSARRVNPKEIEEITS
jgi:hypothetical protein